MPKENEFLKIKENVVQKICKHRILVRDIMASETTTCIKAVSKIDEVNIQEAKVGRARRLPTADPEVDRPAQDSQWASVWGRPLEFEVQWVPV